MFINGEAGGSLSGKIQVAERKEKHFDCFWKIKIYLSNVGYLENLFA